MIYFIQNRFDGSIKIGRTKHIKTRFNQLQSASPHDLEVLGVLNGSPEEEKKLHRKFAGHHIAREWYEPHADLMEFISEMTNPFSPTEPKTVKIMATIDNWVSIDEASRQTGYSKRHIRLLAKEHEIKAQKMGKIWLIFLPSLLEYKPADPRGRPRGGYNMSRAEQVDWLRKLAANIAENLGEGNAQELVDFALSNEGRHSWEIDLPDWFDRHDYELLVQFVDESL